MFEEPSGGDNAFVMTQSTLREIRSGAFSSQEEPPFFLPQGKEKRSDNESLCVRGMGGGEKNAPPPKKGGGAFKLLGKGDRRIYHGSSPEKHGEEGGNPSSFHDKGEKGRSLYIA